MGFVSPVMQARLPVTPETARHPPSSGDCLDFRRRKEHGWIKLSLILKID